MLLAGLGMSDRDVSDAIGRPRDLSMPVGIDGLPVQFWAQDGHRRWLGHVGAPKNLTHVASIMHAAFLPLSRPPWPPTGAVATCIQNVGSSNKAQC